MPYSPGIGTQLTELSAKAVSPDSLVSSNSPESPVSSNSTASPDLPDLPTSPDSAVSPYSPIHQVLELDSPIRVPNLGRQ